MLLSDAQEWQSTMTRELGMVHRDLRRALKAAAMRYRIPTSAIARVDYGQPGSQRIFLKSHGTI